MKIDASRFNSFWACPDKYRLRECWKLAPEEPKADSFAALLSFGRRRGTCLHELVDGRYKGVDPLVSLQELRDGGFGEREIEAARRMLAVIPAEETLAHEVLFEHPIAGGHIMTGRIDSIIRRDGEVFILDYKSSKARTKAEIRRKLDDYCRGAQVGFYYVGARALGFQPSAFIYSLVEDAKDGVRVHEQRTERTGLDLKSFERTVALTCNLIEHLKETYGIEDSWPVLAEPFTSGYANILGRKMYRDYMPEGYVPKVEHLETMRGEPDAS